MSIPTSQFNAALAFSTTAAPLDVVSVPTASIVLSDNWRPSAADQFRQARMQNAWNAYLGNLPKPLKKQRGFGNVDDNIMTNRIKPMVRTARSLLFGKPLKMTVDDDGPSGAQDWCDAFAKSVRFDIFCKELKSNGALCGSAFWKIVPHKPYPRLVLIDPQNISVIVDPDDWTVVLAYVQSYQVVEPPNNKLVDRRHVEYRENADSDFWTIVDLQKDAGAATWGAPKHEEKWPYSWAPIHACKNLPSANEWWGEPDVDDDLVGLNMALNFVQSNTNRILKIHAHPKTWGRGFDAKAIDVSVDSVIALPSADAELHNLEMVSDLRSSMDHANSIREDMDELSSIPAVALSRLSAMPRGAMSGVTIAMLYQPAMNRVDDARELYGPALEETFTHALEWCGMGKEIVVHATWQEILPRDEQADWTVAQQQLECGVSKHQILEDHHLDYDEQAAWIAEEKEDAQANTPPQLLALNRGVNQPPMPPVARGLPAPQQQQPANDDGTYDSGGQPAA